jgi:hypothetical protein
MRATIPLVIALAACSSSPTKPLDQRYAQQSWSKIPVEQAYAECRDDINRDTASGSLRLCMRAKGWEER